MLDTWEETEVKEDENGLIWIYKNGIIVCEAFFPGDNTMTEMMDAGYILVPYRHKGEQIFVESK